MASLGDGITLLPLTAALAAPLETAATKRAAAVIRRLTASHDIVLVDAGVIGPEGAPSIISGEGEAAVDAAVLVLDVRCGREDHLSPVLTELAQRGIPAVALAENFAGGTAAGKPSRVSRSHMPM